MDENPSKEKSYEQLVVNVKFEKRPQIQAVKLERKQIKMTRPPDTVPCIVTITTEEDEPEPEDQKKNIVGDTDPLEEETQNEKDVALTEGHAETSKEADKTGSRLTVKDDEKSARRSDAIAFFEQQEQIFRDQIKLLPTPKKQRSPSPGALRQSVGLDHLDNLVRLMEQLSTLRDENSRLKNRCQYLESTKDLLKIKSAWACEMMPLEYTSLPKTKAKLRKSHTDPEPREARRSRDRLRHEITIQDFADSSSDRSPKRPKAATLHKRSYSTGSIDIPSEIIEEEELMTRQIGVSKSTKVRKEIRKHKKSKGSKWMRVKKVFSEDLGSSIKSLREFGKGAIRYTGIGSPSELSPLSPRVYEGRSLDSGVSSSMDGQGFRMSTSSTEAQSPSRSPDQTEDPDLCTDVWMGPPEWLVKQRDERKESSCSGVSSDVSSVIEMKNIYLGKDSSGSKKYLKVRSKLPRRRSSPTLLLETGDMDSLEAESAPLHRSSSYKSETDSIQTDDVLTVRSLERESKKQKTTWKRVKDIIHIRKDSSKKKKHRIDPDEESSEVDIEVPILRDEQFSGEFFGEGVTSRSTPKTSPSIVRPLGPSHSDLSYLKTALSRSPAMGPPSPNMDLAALMASGVTDEFSKKLQEWEHKKSRKSLPSIRGTVDECDAFSQDSSRSSELDRSKGREPVRKIGVDTSDEEDALISAETSTASVNVDDLQRRITESFSRKLQEWERIKYRRDTKEGSPEIQRKESSKIRKEDRPKSKKSREDREKEKMEKLREREIQKVEREQMKLDKEKMRLDKERLRALEREAKLEKMKGRLSQTDSDPMFKNPVLSPLAEYKVTADFAHKLHEWEVKRGLSHDVSTAIYLEAQKRSAQQALEGLMEVPQMQSKHERSKSDSDVPIPLPDTSTQEPSAKPPPLTLQPFWGTPEASPVEKTSDISYGDDTSVTEDSMITRSNIHSLEKANALLLEKLTRKEEDYSRIQEEVKQLNNKLEEAKNRRAGEEAYLSRKSEHGLVAVSFEPMSVASTVVDLEEKIKQLQSLGENLADSMESAAVGKFNTVEGEGSVSTQLMEMVDKMKDMLSHASQTDEASQKSTALHDFEKLYSQAMTLQVQMNNLRLSHLERNKEIMDIKRQLLLQEVNNLLLQVDITRRESELYHYHEDGSGQTGSTEADGALKPMECMDTSLVGEADKGDTDDVIGGETIQHIPLATAESSEPENASKKKSKKKEKKEKKVKEKKEKKSTLFHSKSSKKDSKKQTDQSTKSCKKLSGDGEDTSKKKSSATEQSLELSCSLVLPTATVSLPREPSQAETAVPKVEKESPTLAKSHQEVICHRSETSKPEKRVTIETPEKPIPESQPRREKPKLKKTVSVVDDEYSSEIVVERTASHVDSSDLHIHSDNDQPSGTITRAEVGQATLIPSPVIKSKYPHTRGGTGLNKENGRCASPKPILKHSQPVSKPPLPKQSTPVTHSPVLIHSVKNGSRSKSVDEVRSRKSHLSEREPGRVMFSIQDKRATVCESHVLELRKTPSPTLYLPRVGLVTPVKPLKPAAELLEESQRYRKGHSVFTTRILQRYQQKEEQRLRLEMLQKHDKENVENISCISAKSLLKKLREGTPAKSTDSSTSESSLSLGVDSSLQVELAQHLSRSLTSSSGSEKPKSSAPFRDLTNGGQSSEIYVIDSPERTLSESVLQTTSRTSIPKLKRRSCEVGVSYDPSSETSTFLIVTTTTGPVVVSEMQPESTISTTNHSSMPTLSTTRQDSFEQEPARDRSATYAASSRYTGPDDVIESIGTCREKPTTSQSGPVFSSSKQQSPTLLHLGARPTSPKSPDRRAGRKMGTIGVLCKQSISFDLGVSLYSPLDSAVGGRQRDSTGSTSPRSTSRPTSTSSEGEVASTSKEEKKKQRSKFLDSKWLQKPKKFFKVSK